MRKAIFFSLFVLCHFADAEAWYGFQPAQNLAVGSNPQSVVVADFNGDGFMDIAVANADNGVDPGSISVLLNNGEGAFSAPTSYSVGPNAVSLVVGDFNGDNIPDLAVLNCSNATISVLLGNGDGTFAAPFSFNVSDDPQSISAGDYNGDGLTDIAVAYGVGSSTPSTVGIFLSDGMGGFTDAGTTAVGSDPNALVSADLNGDNIFDIATANIASDDVSVLIGQGDGSFQPGQTPSVGGAPWGVAAGDIDGDGRVDLVVTNVADASVTVLKNNGDGTFAGGVDYNVGTGPRGVALADFSGSGFLDIATANAGDDNISILVNGNFASQQTFAVGTFPVALAAGDINGDGQQDLVVVNAGSDSISILINKLQQTINFAHISNQVFGNPPITLIASASSGLLVTFSVVSGPATVSGNILTLLGPGTVVVAASQSGDDTYASVTVFQSFTVAPFFNGKQEKNRFLTQYELVNRLQWTSPTNPLVTGFKLLRNGVQIGSFSALGPFYYNDHNRKREVAYTYQMIAHDATMTTLYSSELTL